MDNGGNILAPMVCAAVNIHDTELLPDSLKHLQKVAKILYLDLTGVKLNLDCGFDSKANRKTTWNGKFIPNIPENPRNRDISKPKRGRPRYFNIKSFKKRFVSERTFAWEDAFRGLVIRYDRKSSHYMGHKLLAYTLINLRYFCGRSQ